MLTEDYYAQPGFSSTLPLLTLTLPDSTLAQEEEDYYLNVGVIGFDGQLSNTLEGIPSLTQAAVLRNMVDPANQTVKKNDYYLRFESNQNLLGLGAASEYFLLGGMHDKSLLRNYIGYSMAAQIMPNAVEFGLCELFFRDEKGDLYQGVYLLVAQHFADAPNGFLFHRNIRGDGILIETYASANDASFGYMSIPFIQSSHWDEHFDQPVGGISHAESVLYSNESRTFYNYSSWFDVPAFSSSFILGELTENYEGMIDEYYLYDSEEAVVTVAPLWNFDQAFDNRENAPVSTGNTHYQEAPYYENFFKSPQFVRQLQERYLMLRQKGLEEVNLIELVEEGVALVVHAVPRDWDRWDSYSSQVLQPLAEIELGDKEDGQLLTERIVPVSRQTDSYEEEITRIKNTLREHSLYFAYAITQFNFSEREISRESIMNVNPIWAGLFLVAIFTLIRFVRRYGI